MWNKMCFPQTCLHRPRQREYHEDYLLLLHKKYFVDIQENSNSKAILMSTYNIFWCKSNTRPKSSPQLSPCLAIWPPIIKPVRAQHPSRHTDTNIIIHFHWTSITINVWNNLCLQVWYSLFNCHLVWFWARTVHWWNILAIFNCLSVIPVYLESCHPWTSCQYISQ